MADIRTSTQRVRVIERSQHPRRRIPWLGVGLCALSSATAFWLGDMGGYARGSQEAARLANGDDLGRMDCLAQLHARKRKEARDAADKAAAASATPVVASAPAQFGFHEALKGGPAARPVTERPMSPAPPAAAATPRPAPVAAAAPAAPRALVEPAASAASVPSALPASAPARDNATATSVAPGAALMVHVPAPSPAGKAALSAGPSVGSFTLQAGSFPAKEDALRLFEKLKARGLKPAIVPAMSGDQTWYRVRVGRFADRAAAEDGARDLQATTGAAGVITQH